jgi:hypothetical protein
MLQDHTMKLFDTIAKAWKAFIARKKLLLLAVPVDFLFYMLLAQLHYEIFNRASAAAMKLTALMGDQAQQLATSEAVPDLATLQSPAFTAAFHELMLYACIFIAAAVALWLVGKGILWFIAHKTADKKVNTALFAKKFIGMTLFWALAFIVVSTIALNVLDYALFSPIPLIGEAGANFVIFLLFAVFAYFVFLSYALIPNKVFLPTLTLGFTRWKELVPVHLIGILLYFVAVSVPTSLVKLNIYLSLAMVVLVSLPAIAFSRALWATAAQQVVKHA